jgi:hypothetical protein
VIGFSRAQPQAIRCSAFFCFKIPTPNLDKRDFYYFSDALLAFFLFLSLCELSVRLVGTKKRRKRVVLLGAGALVATAWFSFGIVSQSSFMMTHFAYAYGSRKISIRYVASLRSCFGFGRCVMIPWIRRPADS